MDVRQRRRNDRRARCGGGLVCRTHQGGDRADRGGRLGDQRGLRAHFRAGARRGAGRRRAARRRRAWTAARRADDDQGILQSRGDADHVGLCRGEGLQARRGRPCGPARQGSGRRHPRQNQCAGFARRLAELQRRLWRHQESVRSRALAGRLVRRLLGGAGGGLRRALARLGHRRLAPGPRAFLRRVRAQADP